MAFRYALRQTKRARKTKGRSWVAKGKKPKVGKGKRFAALKATIAKRGGVRNPAAVAAMIGRKKFGKARFQRMAAAGRRRKRR